MGGGGLSNTCQKKTIWCSIGRVGNHPCVVAACRPPIPPLGCMYSFFLLGTNPRSQRGAPAVRTAFLSFFLPGWVNDYVRAPGGPPKPGPSPRERSVTDKKNRFKEAADTIESREDQSRSDGVPLRRSFRSRYGARLTLPSVRSLLSTPKALALCRGSCGGGSSGVSGDCSGDGQFGIRSNHPAPLATQPRAEHRSTAAGVIRQDADALSGRAMRGDDHPTPTDCMSRHPNLGGC